MYRLFRPLLFRLDPEQAHHLTLELLRLVGRFPPLGWALGRLITPEVGRRVEAFGLTFPNPVGLAAGYDKDGLAWRGLASLGFGHIEVGTVTPRPQPGNAKPRLFRLPASQALINRMGFPGKGGSFVARQLAGPRPHGLVLGVNLGVNKDTPLEAASGDYLGLMEHFAPLADYLAINVSSPNTVGLRRLQAREQLEDLLRRLMAARPSASPRQSRPIPLLVKLSPDLSDDELDDALEVILVAGVDGVIATNTTVSREGLDSPLASERGGVSGMPLRQRSTEVVRQICDRTGGALPVIAVGGVNSADAAREKLDAGAALVQIYTGLVYRGPGLIREIVEVTARP
jgi:dihydroorotate dehydrogenase